MLAALSRSLPPQSHASFQGGEKSSFVQLQEEEDIVAVPLSASHTFFHVCVRRTNFWGSGVEGVSSGIKLEIQEGSGGGQTQSERGGRPLDG